MGDEVRVLRECQVDRDHLSPPVPVHPPEVEEQLLSLLQEFVCVEGEVESVFEEEVLHDVPVEEDREPRPTGHR